MDLEDLFSIDYCFQTAELPADIRSRLVCGPLQFVPKYIYVEEEWTKLSNSDDKVTELLNKYKRENGKILFFFFHSRP